ncbi:SpaA isopeptide-forming pilin-related protein [Flavonifractor plautii]|uniref:SpaA isopeptide-forming pilin-related protein n=1 Tax=Flavonifractor plautii TaxID=292800 RepID=UPI0011071294|nr:SpaA isopeptide-forming pilin-related protein [Flavonifractor plautii]MDB7917922.1 SpaA isopeptide-forming pilin-related protein [Flavonifractor plautii]MDB7941828.1 SpaA isopeptide-forming pilin-related protein [Flavonifractor plautii]
MKKLISLFLALVTILGILPTAAFAASSEEEALGEVDIYNGDYELGYLSINGAVRKQKYTYFLYESNDGTQKESPAYCVNPNQYGVPQTVGPGESIKYLAEEKASDPKVVGIISNGYPHRSLGELELDNKYQAYYATKMALWCYLMPDWNIADLKVAPGLTGSELDIGNRILAAAKDIYKRGTTYNYMLSPRMTVTANKSTAYPVTIGGEEYKQQVFTVWSETWVYDYDVSVAFSNPDEVPEGTKIVDMENNEITAVTTEGTSDGYAGQFKVLYPAESVAGQSGNVQLSLSASVAQYAAMYAVCQEKDQYGNLQNYICDLDNNARLDLAAISSYSDSGEPAPDETALKIVKLEEGTEIPLEGAVFSVYDPEGRKVGSYSTGPEGTVLIPLTLEGHYTVTEEIPPRYHLLPEETTQHADVEYNKVATVTFTNAPYGSIRVQKMSDTGDALSGVTIQIKHIETGETRTEQTRIGVAFFDQLAPGGWEVREAAGIEGWIADTDTVQTVAVAAGEESSATIVNKELPGLRITKYERGTMTLMPNVSFEIFRDAESLGIFQTDEFGQILLTDCAPGTYRAEERDTGGDGHVLDTTPQEVELKAGDGIKELVFFNDRLPGIHLIKVDSADLSQPIANARFRIEAVDGSWGPEEYTTSEDGTIDLSKLPADTAYIVTELECPGYIVDDAQRIIHLDGGEQAQFVFTNSKMPSLHLYKESADGTPLGGVTYRLAKIEDGGHYLDRITGPDGTITWEGLEPGVYSLVETATVSDHILDTRKHHVQLFPGRDGTIVLQNDRRPDLTIHKSDADTGAPVPGTVFLVKGADGHSVAEVTTGPDGSATVENLLPGVYEVSEKSVPSPYLPDADPQLVTLYPNRDRDVYFENHKRPTVTIQKENSITHDPIQYAEFHITWASNKTDTGELRDLGTFQTDEAGQIILEGIEDGWLKIEETKPAPGFQAPEDPVTEVYVKGGENKTVTISNTPLSALVVYKRDSVTGAGISGCLFQLRYLGGETSGVGGTVVGTYVTSANGSFTVTGLKKGYYICEELESDSGHVIDAAPQAFYISGANQDIVTLYFSNAPKGSVLVKKVSASDNAPLSDVEFLVTTSDGAVVGDANGKFVTDSTGSFLISGIDPGTTLVIRETRAKDGYLLDDAPQTVQVKEGQTVTVEFRNQPMGNLIIHKLSSKDKTPLEGVQFKITYADGTYLPDEGGKLSSNGLYWTNAEGQIVLSGITGTVVVTEVESIPGYTIDPDTQSQTVVVNPDDTQELWFYNTPVGGVELIKVSSADKTERIPNTTFDIRRVSDDALVDTVTTGRSGKVYLPLESGDYYAVETEAADGFKLDDTPIYFTVKDAETTRKTVTNAPLSGILLHKVSTADGEGIPGVSFILYDETHTPIDQQTTDDRGYAWFEDLTESGRYYLRELENEGYIPDTQLRTVYVKAGEVTEVEWENTPITGQIQITKKSADYNPTTGLPAGTLLEGAVFEITDKAGNVVDTIRSDSRGLAVSKQLPLSRYTIQEVKAPEHYGVNETELTAYLEHEGQIVRFEVTNKSLSTGVSISKTGPKEVVSGQPVRYTFSGISNTSNVRLDSFYFRDTLPAQVRLEQVVTGTWNFPGVYKIVYKVNGTGDYRTLADNLSTSQTYTLAASPAALGLAANERVTEIMFVFGQAPAGFAQVEAPVLYCTSVNGLAAGSSFVNVADVGGVYNGQWVQAVSRWVTTVYGKPEPLPRTGY